jgi:hypothetical protein
MKIGHEIPVLECRICGNRKSLTAANFLKIGDSFVNTKDCKKCLSDSPDKKLCGKCFNVYLTKHCKICLEKDVSTIAGKELNTGAKGAIQEYRIIVDLMVKGYEVFRACSPNQSCDLIATKGATVVKVECKTVNVKLNGDVGKVPRNIDKHDVLACITKDGRIFYLNSEFKEVSV